MLAILSTHPIQYQVPLWQALANHGSVPFEVWYLTDHGVDPSYDQQFGKSFAWDLDLLGGYPYRFLKVNSDANVSSFSKLRLAERLQPLFHEKDVSALWIQGWQALAYWQTAWQAHSAGIPAWLRGESNDLAPLPAWKKPVKQLMLGKLFKRVDKFLYIGEANRRFYSSYGVSTDQLHHAPYCVDNERFAAQAEELRPRREEIRRAWNIPQNAFCVLFAGKFIDKKRPFDLVNALKDKRIQEQDRPVHILFVGSGNLAEALRSACHVFFDADSPNGNHTILDHHPTKPAASFAGFLNQREISKAYVAADCLVLPSDHRETWGLVVNEAMASGLPCIVSDACGCGEDLVAPINPKGRYAWGDTAALAEALIDTMQFRPSASDIQETVNRFRLDVTVETITNLFYVKHHRLREASEPAVVTQ